MPSMLKAPISSYQNIVQLHVPRHRLSETSDRSTTEAEDHRRTRQIDVPLKGYIAK
jgi:hypothetical protein